MPALGTTSACHLLINNLRSFRGLAPGGGTKACSGLACAASVRRITSSSPHYASSSARWKQRQGSDVYAREAKVQGLKSRAAFKLLEMDARYKLFRTGQVVVDLGFAPGSWSQVAVERTKPSGRVVGIDLIPAQPPKGVSTIQGNFLSPAVHALVKQFLLDSEARHKARPKSAETAVQDSDSEGSVMERPSYIDMERQDTHEPDTEFEDAFSAVSDAQGNDKRLVDIVLSDMMMNTSGISFKDHVGSMDLCMAALAFASDTLKAGGHFVCKFYQGAEDKALENVLRKMFAKVHREKPESSRSESRESFFVALRRKGDVTIQDVQDA